MLPSSRTRRRGYKQYAFFMSVDFDIIPKVLTMTVGTRYFKFSITLRGSTVSSFGCFEAARALRGATTSTLKENLDLFGLQEPRQCDLARYARYHAVLHLLAGLPSRWVQPERRSQHAYGPDGVDQIANPLKYRSD